MFHKIGGLSKTMGSNTKGEFTIHVPTEYDYRFISDRYFNICILLLNRRDEIFEVIKQRFVEKMQVNLPIFGIAKGNLRDFTTTEKDMKRG